MDKVAHHTKVRRIPRFTFVDSAEIGRRGFILPGDILAIARSDSRKSAEVIVVVATSHAKGMEVSQTTKD
jgi:hypothetical protein